MKFQVPDFNMMFFRKENCYIRSRRDFSSLCYPKYRESRSYNHCKIKQRTNSQSKKYRFHFKQAGVNIRPQAIECLKELSKTFELIVFTASHPYYADVVIDILDPNKTLFAKRLFRSSCIHTDNGLYIKDLRVLNCDLNSTVIVDNSILSFAFQLDNGIPIIPFYDDKEDNILPKIKDYIQGLAGSPDVREINRKSFCLTELSKHDVPCFLKYYYQDEISENEDYDDIVEDCIDTGVEPFTTESPRTRELRRKSMTLLVRKQEDVCFKSKIIICKRTQELVEDELDKLQESLPLYLKSHQADIA